MQDAGKEECEKGSHSLGHALIDTFTVNMTQKEFVYGPVPFSCEFIESGAVPPVLVKRTVRKPCHFCDCVGDTIENDEKEEKP